MSRFSRQHSLSMSENYGISVVSDYHSGMNDLEDIDLEEDDEYYSDDDDGISRSGGMGSLSRSDYDLNTPESTRREHHNKLEQKRRASIKGSYNELKEVIPGLKESKASRAVVLRKAVECIKERNRKVNQARRELERMKSENDSLERNISEMQRRSEIIDDQHGQTGTSCHPTAATGGNVSRQLSSSSSSGSFRLLPCQSGYHQPTAFNHEGGTSSESSSAGSSGLPHYRLLPKEEPSGLDQLSAAAASSSGSSLSTSPSMAAAAAVAAEEDVAPMTNPASLCTSSSGVSAAVANATICKAVGSVLRRQTPQSLTVVRDDPDGSTRPRVRRASFTLCEPLRQAGTVSKCAIVSSGHPDVDVDTAKRPKLS